jgi:hypothetical protein
MSISTEIGARLTVIGNVIESGLLAARTLDGTYRHLKRIEHDSFTDGGKGNGYFERLGIPQECFGEVLDPRQIEKVLTY